MLLFAYLDKLPPIPTYLVEQQKERYQNHHALSRTMPDGSVAVNIDYRRWDLDDDINSWLKQNICEADATGLQISRCVEGSTTHLCHTDSYPRRWVINYMFETGGTAATTRFFKEVGQPLTRDPLTRPVPEYDPGIEVIHSVVIEPYRWCILNSSVLHDVVGITGERKSITMALSDKDPFSRIPAYQNSISI